MLCLLYNLILCPSRGNQVTSVVKKLCTPAYLGMLLKNLYSTTFTSASFSTLSASGQGPLVKEDLPVVLSVDRIDLLPACCEGVSRYED